MKTLFARRAPLAAALLLAAAALLAGCASISPQTRSQAHAAAFKRLSPRDQQLVLAGQIHEGMDRESVYIAWGPPNGVYQGSARGQTTETWVYLQQPAARPSPEFPLYEADYLAAAFALPSTYYGGPYLRSFYYPAYTNVAPYYPGPVSYHVNLRPVKKVVFGKGRVVKYEVLRREG